MAVGKNKGLSKGTKKGNKKKVIDPFSRKDWYDIKAPNVFSNRQVGKTLVNRTQGTRIASDSLKHRVFEVSLDDLQYDLEDATSFRKFKLIVEDVQGSQLLTNFHGMDMTTDKIKSMVRKWQTLIEAFADVRTTDGYLLRVFCIGFTAKQDLKASRKACYAQKSRIRSIRKKMIKIMTRDVASSNLREFVLKLLPDSIAKDIEKECQIIYPLYNVFIRKVKVLKKPRFDLSRLLEMHGDVDGQGVSVSIGMSAEGVCIGRAEGYEPPVQTMV